MTLNLVELKFIIGRFMEGLKRNSRKRFYIDRQPLKRNDLRFKESIEEFTNQELIKPILSNLGMDLIQIRAKKTWKIKKFEQTTEIDYIGILPISRHNVFIKIISINDELNFNSCIDYVNKIKYYLSNYKKHCDYCFGLLTNGLNWVKIIKETNKEQWKVVDIEENIFYLLEALK